MVAVMKAVWIVVLPLGMLGLCWGFLRTAVELHEYHIRRKHALLKKRAVRAVRWGL